MVPIGIITRNRVAYLDVTLRSLSATDLPVAVPVVIYDDASTDRAAKDYLYTAKPVNVPRVWPLQKSWHTDLGLGIVNSTDVIPRGVKGRLRVELLGDQAYGVVEASRKAICHLLSLVPDAPGVILLQDDVVFNVDWYTRLTTTAANHVFESPLGVLAGIKLNKTFPQAKGKTVKNPAVAPSGITAQCLYVTRTLVEQLEMFKVVQTQRTQFDDMLKKRASRNGFWVGCILPFVCQHIGIQSSVRPGRGWHRVARGRVGYHAMPPYVLAKEIKQF